WASRRFACERRRHIPPIPSTSSGWPSRKKHANVTRLVPRAMSQLLSTGVKTNLLRLEVRRFGDASVNTGRDYSINLRRRIRAVVFRDQRIWYALRKARRSSAKPKFQRKGQRCHGRGGLRTRRSVLVRQGGAASP